MPITLLAEMVRRVSFTPPGTRGITKHAFGATNFNPNPKDDKFLVRIEKAPQKPKETPKKGNLIGFTNRELHPLRPDTHTVRFYHFAY